MVPHVLRMVLRGLAITPMMPTYGAIDNTGQVFSRRIRKHDCATQRLIDYPKQDAGRLSIEAPLVRGALAPFT